MVAVVVVRQGLVLGPLRRGPEADHGAGCNPQPVGLVGLQLPQRELRLVAPNFNRKRAVCCGENEESESESPVRVVALEGWTAGSLTVIQGAVLDVVARHGPSAVLRRQRMPHEPDVRGGSAGDGELRRGAGHCRWVGKARQSASLCTRTCTYTNAYSLYRRANN